MSERNESVFTSGAVSASFMTVPIPDGATSFEIHWTAFTSSTKSCAGETVIVVAKDPGNPPAIKATVPELHYLGYAGTPTITGSISGDDLVLSANGLNMEDITWLLRIEQF